MIQADDGVQDEKEILLPEGYALALEEEDVLEAAAAVDVPMGHEDVPAAERSIAEPQLDEQVLHCSEMRHINREKQCMYTHLNACTAIGIADVRPAPATDFSGVASQQTHVGGNSMSLSR